MPRFMEKMVSELYGPIEPIHPPSIIEIGGNVLIALRDQIGKGVRHHIRYEIGKSHLHLP